MMNVTFKLWEILLGVLLFIASVYVGYVVSGGSVNQGGTAEENPAPKYTSRDPIVTDFGSTLSPDFPKEIPIEVGALVTQSANKDQLHYFDVTEVFSSVESVHSNYLLYKKFLEQNNWKIVNSGETKIVSNLYGVRGKNEINIVITPSVATSTKSQVNITWINRK